MSARALIVWVALACSGALAQPVNPAVTPDNIGQTICVPHWDEPVRPTLGATSRIKFGKLAALGIPKTDSAKYELDHIISLVLGGAPLDPSNLRIQEWYGKPVATPKSADGLDTQAHVKDALEARLHKLVCAGKLDLREAQQCIFNDWRACALAHP